MFPAPIIVQYSSAHNIHSYIKENTKCFPGEQAIAQAREPPLPRVTSRYTIYPSAIIHSTIRSVIAPQLKKGLRTPFGIQPFFSTWRVGDHCAWVPTIIFFIQRALWMKMIDAVGTFATEELFAFPSDAIPDPFADFPGSEERPHEGTASEDAECDREPEFGDV